MPSPIPAAGPAAQTERAIQRTYEIARRMGVRLPGPAA